MIEEMSFTLKLNYRFNVILINITDFVVELNQHSKRFIDIKVKNSQETLSRRKNGLTIKLIIKRSTVIVEKTRAIV